jgi:transposase-like protein
MGLLQDIVEVLKTVKHRKPSKMYCPKCGSPGIRLSGRMNYWLAPPKYVCKGCGYSGPVVMELEKEEG